MNKSNQCKVGLFFGIAMTVYNIGFDFAIESNYSSSHLSKVIISGIISGALAGLVFGWATGLFANSKFVKRTTKIETAPDEDVKFETPANHFKGLEAVGGRLYLTNKRLIFQSHKLNIQNHLFSIDLGEINYVDRYKTLGLVNNGLLITTSQSVTEKFVVEEVENWVSFLTEQKSSQPV